MSYLYLTIPDIGKALDSKEYKAQFDRYRAALDNLIITDYCQFDFYRSGEKVTSIRLATIDNKTIKPLPDNFEQFINLIKDFASYSGQNITSAIQLSKIMAAKARLLANIIENALNSDEENQENSSLKDQLQAFKSILLHDIHPSEFADIYAQTIAYGMFAARLHDDNPDSFSRQKAAEKIPLSNPFLRKLFQYIAGYDLDNRLVWIVNALADIFRAVNTQKVMSRDAINRVSTYDPIIHFYETFLAEYDPKLRKSRGVWYTPQPVVNFIVRAVDELLKTDFQLAQGLADTSKTTIKIDTPILKGSGKTKYTVIEKRDKEVHKVQILDPATGTGTFLAETVKHIYAQQFQSIQGKWSNYVEADLIPRLNGFEILMASYAMAHLKLDLLLTETGYIPKKQPRFNIYLTNSLEEHHPDTHSLFATWLSQEANEANHIKRDTPVMVVLGNPPYSVSSSNKGDWIQQLVSDYKKDLNEKNIQPLSDDYIKFIRYGSYYIEKNGAGILAYISNNSFIDGVIHRQMRKHLLETFDSIYILDLHGSNKKKETAPDGSKDENVFDIMQGVSINIFVKNQNLRGLKDLAGLATVYHLDLYGLREDKYQTLLNNSISSLAWNKIACRAPEYFFIPKDIDLQKNYNQGIFITDLFLINSSGIQTHRDDFVIDFEKSVLAERIENFCSLSFTNQELKNKFSLKESEQWINEKKQETFNINFIKKIAYRPFDNRYIYYSSRFLDRAREKIMWHFLVNENWGLILKRSRLLGGTFYYRHAAICNNLCDKNFLADQSFVFPLYLYPEPTNQQSLDETNVRRPNLNPELVQQIADKLGLKFVPEKNQTGVQTHEFGLQIETSQPTASLNRETFAPLDILDYIYAVLHSPRYRETYKEFLKIDFPRVPYPDIKTFWQKVKLGGELRELHLVGANSFATCQKPDSGRINSPLQIEYPIDGSDCITRKLNKHDFVMTDNNIGQVWINDCQYFANVPLIAWEFYIGGYQPAQKWLKDRHGRILSVDDIKHYQKIIVALSETDRIMREIDLI